MTPSMLSRPWMLREKYRHGNGPRKHGTRRTFTYSASTHLLTGEQYGTFRQSWGYGSTNALTTYTVGDGSDGYPTVVTSYQPAALEGLASVVAGFPTGPSSGLHWATVTSCCPKDQSVSCSQQSVGIVRASMRDLS